MNGNVTAESDRAPRGSPRSAIGDSQADPKLSLDCSHIRLRDWGEPYTFFPTPCRRRPPLPLLYGSRTGASWYAATVGLHPRVWRLGLHRRARGRRGCARDGERKTKRRKSVNEPSEVFALGPAAVWKRPPAREAAPALGANPAISPRPPQSNFGVLVLLFFLFFIFFFF